ncbi:hypothetical protein [Xanthobacter autotrophicus]|uniref:hypothetical protein n=1 Tax=Xanthobacter autotrophicus TaxID=280 RepID=UPI0037283940
MDWLKAAPEGQLFGNSASSYMSRWVRSENVGIKRKGISPNHGLRHLLTALAQRYQVGDEAREYETAIFDRQPSPVEADKAVAIRVG